jgi:hypothetical protein
VKANPPMQTWIRDPRDLMVRERGVGILHIRVRRPRCLLRSFCNNPCGRTSYRVPRPSHSRPPHPTAADSSSTPHRLFHQPARAWIHRYMPLTKVGPRAYGLRTSWHAARFFGELLGSDATLWGFYEVKLEKGSSRARCVRGAVPGWARGSQAEPHSCSTPGPTH